MSTRPVTRMSDGVGDRGGGVPRRATWPRRTTSSGASVSAKSRPGCQSSAPPRANGQNQRFMIAPYRKPHTQPYAASTTTSNHAGRGGAWRSPTNPAPAPIHASASIWNGSHGPMPAGDDGRHRHRAEPEQQPEAGTERGAGEHDEEEDAAAAAGKVESRSSPATAESIPRIATVAPFIVPRRTSSITAATTSTPTSARRSAARRRCAPGSEHGAGQPERVEERGRSPTTTMSTYTGAAAGRGRPRRSITRRP